MNQVIIEANFGDGMFPKLFQPVCLRKHRCMIEEVKHSSQKEARIIDTLEPVMMRHRLVVDPKLIEADYKSTFVYPIDKQNVYRLFYQMTRITKDRGSLAKDDRLDVLAMAAAYWVESMARDEEQVQAQHKARMQDLELRKFMESFTGKKNHDMWVTV